MKYNFEKMLFEICAFEPIEDHRTPIVTNDNISPLKERRDYGERGHDFLERNMLELKNKGVEVSDDLETQFKNRLQDFPAEKQASIIDYPNKTLCTQIWDISKNPPVLKPSIRKKIIYNLLYVLKKKFKDYRKWLSEVTLTGSIVTNQNNLKSDVDINISIDYDKFREFNSVSKKYKTDKELRQFIRDKVYTLNDKPLVGKHPIKYFVIGKGHRLESDFIYDVLKNEWLNKPKLIPVNFDPDKVFKTEKQHALNLIHKSIILILSIKVLIGDLLRQQDNEKEKNLRQRIEFLKKIEDSIKHIRKIRFEKKHIELLSFGYSKNWEKYNVVFKYIEHYGFKHPLEVLRNLLDDDEKQYLEKIHVTLE
jgi:hypothetical protein